MPSSICSFFRVCFSSTLCVLPGLANLKCFQTAPLILQTMAAPHVTENKLPWFLGIDFHESLVSEFMLWAMFSSAVQASNSPLESCLSRTTEVCLACTHLDFCSLHSLFFRIIMGKSKYCFLLMWHFARNLFQFQPLLVRGKAKNPTKEVFLPCRISGWWFPCLLALVTLVEARIICLMLCCNMCSTAKNGEKQI